MIYMTVVKWTAITQGRVFPRAIWNKFGPWCMEGLVQVMYPSWDKPYCPIGWSEQAVEGWWLAGNEDQEGGSTLPAAAWCGNGMFCFFLLKPFIMTGPKSAYWLNHLWCTGNSYELMAKGGWARSGWKVNGTGQAEIRLIKMTRWVSNDCRPTSHRPLTLYDVLNAKLCKCSSISTQLRVTYHSYIHGNKASWHLKRHFVYGDRMDKTFIYVYFFQGGSLFLLYLCPPG